MFTVNESISLKLWIAAFSFIILGTFCFLTGHWALAGIGAIGCAMIAFGIKLIPANPPNVGILTVGGTRIPVIIRESIVLLAPYWPLLIDVILVPVVRQDEDFEYTGVRCKGQEVGQAGGAVLIKVSVTYQPDYGVPDSGTLITQYLNAGGKEGVNHILADVIGKTSRNIAGLYTWEELIFLQAALEAALLMRVADTKFRLLPRGPDGKILDEAFDYSSEEYGALTQMMRDPLEYINSARLPDGKPDEDERTIRQQELAVFLKCAQINGGGDVLDLGIRITRLNVVKILPEGELATDAETTAREKKQREGENMDFVTEIQLADLYLDKAKARGEEMTLSQALQMVRINRGRDREVVVNSANPLTGAAAVLSGGRGRNR